MYDNAGNLFSDGTNNYLYDAENRVCAVQQIATGGGGSVTGYLYAPDEARMGKNVNLTSFSCDMTKNGMLTPNGLVLTNLYTVGPQGEQLEETDGSSNLIHFNVFWEGKVLGSYSGATYAQTNWHFALNDWVGTKRVITNSVGGYSTSFFNGPFGDFQTQSGSGSDPSEHHFAGKERDTESNLDYFPARYYNSNLGRFLSPDSDTLPDDVPYADFNNPQSLNLYAYVGNNPLSQTDADGHDVNVCTTGSDGNQQCSLLTNDQYQAAQQAGNGGLNVPSLNSVGTNGSGSITDANGNTVGSATYVSNGGADYYGNQAGYNLLGAASRTVNYATAGAAAVYGAAFLGPAASGMGSSLITLGVSSGPALFAAGQLFEHTFETSAGEVGFLAEVESTGSTLILKDVAVYPTGTSGSLNVGTGQVMQALHQLENLARSQGFTQLQITGQRLSGANPGGLVNITRNLK
jgi:RHS repeat-associated protein